MNKEEFFELITRHTCELIPELEGHAFQWSDRLKDLGANSMDRADIVMMTMESLSLRMPLVELANVTNIGELADAFYEKLQSA
jgi:polyketide biosynthesis acyl carrier protein